MTTTDFKLIAIRPTTNCNTDFTKILTTNKVYRFYNEFDFSDYSDSNRRVTLKSNTPDLYSLRGRTIRSKKLTINFSAIVGENGSGKSSLVELFYVFCYNISAIQGVLYDEEEERFLNKKDIVKSINVEIFYKIGNVIKLLKLQDDKISSFNLKENIFTEEYEFSIRDFFYTISINYSLHALNSEIIGTWVKRVFHKNDSYQTPIVLNPFRKEGNIEINNEEYLVRSRLISNVLGEIDNTKNRSQSLRNILDDKIAYRLHCSVNIKKIEFDNEGKPIFKSTKEIGEKVLPIVYKHFLNDDSFRVRPTILNQYSNEYILNKLRSISKKYNQYKNKDIAFDSYDKKELDSYIKRLSQDKSHVTFKLRQAINFLKNDLFVGRGEKFDLTIAYLSRMLNEEKRKTNTKLINILPPAFFDIDIEFKKGSFFNQLSSGEKQRVYSLSTLIYHLKNLDSVDEETSKLTTYKNVNVVFDEIELYFHPELQRTLISDIIENLSRVNFKNIKSVNFLLITHSPFILSDIIDSNILFLEKNSLQEKHKKIKTFGGNIHQLLAHSFFLKNGLIGEFAKNKIQEIIDILNKKDKIRKIEKQKAFDIINMIGEPFLREKLFEMYYSKFEKAERIRLLERESERIDLEIKRLKD